MLDKFRETAITWDKATKRIYSPITANESDSNGRKLNIQVVNSGQVENLTGATLHLYWETKDKSQYGLDAFTASDISKGEFEIFYTTGMLSNVGELNATLVLVDSTGKVVSDWFKITVARGIDNDAIQSENSFSSLTQALIDISNLEQNYAPRLNNLTAQLQQTEQNLSSQLADIEVSKAEQNELTQLQGVVTSLTVDNADGLKDAELVATRTNKFGQTFASAQDRVTRIESIADLTSTKKTTLSSFVTRYRKFDTNTVNQANDTYASLYYDVKDINAVLIVTTKTRALSNIYTLLDKNGAVISWQRNEIGAETDYTNIFVDTTLADVLIISVTEGNQALINAVGFVSVLPTIEKFDVVLKQKTIETGYFYQNGTKTAGNGNTLHTYNVEAFDYLNLTLTQTYAKNAFTLLDANLNVIRYAYNDSTTKNYTMTNEHIFVGDAVYLAVSYMTKPAPVVTAKVLKSDLLLNYALLNPIKFEKGYYRYNTGEFMATLGKNAIWYSVKTTDKVNLTYLSPAYTNIYTLMDDNFKVLKVSENNTASNVQQTNLVVDVSTATYLIINPIETESYSVYGLKNYNLENTERNSFLTGAKQWKNKKIVWFGTSIPAGGLSGLDRIRSYPMMVGERLGATVYNEAVGSSSVHCKAPENISGANPYGFNNNFENCSRCLSNTIEEMQWIIDNFNGGVFTQNVPANLAQADIDFILSCSWENKLMQHLNGTTHLFVFDHGHNDGIGADDAALEVTYGEDNLYSFQGAMNFLIRKIKSYDPRAKIVMVGEYENQKTPLVPPKQVEVAEKWNIPLYKQWEKLGWSQETVTVLYNWINNKWTYTGTPVQMTLLQTWIPDNLHPHTDYDGRALSWMTENLVAWFMREVR